MPGLSGRMSTVVKAKISKLLDRAEDPAETLEYSYQKQIELLQNVKKGIADVVTSKKRLQLQEEKLQQQVVKLDTQARQALAAGNEELARVALERKNVAQTELQSLDSQIAQLEQQQEQMTASEQKLRTKIEQFRSKKEVIKAQYSAAEAQVRISEAATGVGEEMADVGLAMQRALDKTENMKARADAVQELEAAGTFEDLTALGSGEDDIDRQLKELSSTSEVDAELAKMKAELGAGSASKGELGAGSRRRRPRQRRGLAGAGSSAQRRARSRLSDRPDLHRGAVRGRRRRHRRAQRARQPAVDACESADEEQLPRGVRPAARAGAHQGHAGRRRRAGGLGHHPAAARCLARGGQDGVHGRGPDPRLTSLADGRSERQTAAVVRPDQLPRAPQPAVAAGAAARS